MGEHDHTKFVGMTKGQFLILIISIFMAALIISVSVLSLSISTTSSDVDDVRAVAAKVEANSQRSCRAIQGAVEFWRQMLQAVEHRLYTPDLNPYTRASDEMMVVALLGIINKGEALNC